MMINGKKNSLGTVTTTHLCQLSMFMGVHQELWAKAQNQHIGMIHTHTLSPPSFCLIPFLAPFPMIPHDTYPGVPVDIRSWSTWMCCIIIRNLNQTTTYFPGLGFNQFWESKKHLLIRKNRSTRLSTKTLRPPNPSELTAVNRHVSR